MTKTVYNYHHLTGEFLCVAEADESPLEPGIYLVPQHATIQEPPSVQQNEVCVFANDAWTVQADWRGTHYWSPDGSEITIHDIGDTIPPDGSLSGPPIAALINMARVQVRATRASVFASLAGLQSQALANGDTVIAKAICGLQDSLKTLPNIDLSACKTQSDIDAAFTAAWMSIVAAAPPSVVSAFNLVQS